MLWVYQMLWIYLTMDIGCLAGLHFALFAVWILGHVMSSPYNIYLVSGLMTDPLGMVGSYLIDR